MLRIETRTETAMNDESPMPDDKLYTIHGRRKITLSAEAREMAQMHNMSETRNGEASVASAQTRPEQD